MYLNVNLTPSGEGGSCGNTPKTPEILNSLISLSTSPLASYTCQQMSAGDLLSPTSSSTSPSEEKPFQQIGTPTSSCNPQLSLSGSSDPGGGTYGFTRMSCAFRGIPTSIGGTPSPPVPELPSPVNTLEATKSALIKEGLKIQIKSKLLSAGLEPSELLSDTKTVKEELSDSAELTPQDEERRMRRRERNKVAATKCRNKKKEKTVILMSESETVEDQNLRLKSEIQRLKSEKMKLKKLLEDPNHVASCRHSCTRATHQPLVVITSPDAPEQLLSPSSAEGVLPPTGVSEQSGSELVATLSYCSPNVSSSWDSSFSSDSPSPSYINLSPSTISPLSLPSVSPPHLIVSNNHSMPPHTANQYLPQTGSCFNYADKVNVLSLSPSTDIAVTLPSLVTPVTGSMPGPSLELMASSSSSSNNFLSPKPSNYHSQKRHQPYSMPRSSRASHYQVNGSMTSHTPELECRDYYPSFTNESDVSQDIFFRPLSASEYSFSSISSPVTATGKSRVSTSTPRCRYTPYDKLNRQQNIHNICSTVQPVMDSTQLSKEDPYLPVSCNPYKTDLCPTTQFYPTCTYENI